MIEPWPRPNLSKVFATDPADSMNENVDVNLTRVEADFDLGLLGIGFLIICRGVNEIWFNTLVQLFENGSESE